MKNSYYKLDVENLKDDLTRYLQEFKNEMHSIVRWVRIVDEQDADATLQQALKDIDDEFEKCRDYITDKIDNSITEFYTEDLLDELEYKGTYTLKAESLLSKMKIEWLRENINKI